MDVPVGEGGCWETGSCREVGPPYQELLELCQEVWSLVKSWHGALPEWRREELEMEELLSKSEFPFSEHCPLSDVT